MQKEKSKVKSQNAKGKTEQLPLDTGLRRNPLTRPASAAEGAGVSPSCLPRGRGWGNQKLLLLTFAFCVLTFAFALCLLPTVLNAQGCAMCYTSASAARAGAKEALANGVLILLVPPMVFFALITVVVYMHRNRFREMSVVRGPLSVAVRPNDPEFRRSDDPSAEAPDFGFWSPDHPISDSGSPMDSVGVRRSDIRSPDLLPRATDNGPRTTGKQSPWAG